MTYERLVKLFMCAIFIATAALLVIDTFVFK
jgi:hypothetical protein